MASPYEIARRHLEAAVAEAGVSSIPPETVASAMLNEAVAVLKRVRPKDDVASELSFLIENLEDKDYAFLRP